MTVLQAIIDAAVDATGAARGWIVRSNGDHLSVAAVAGSSTATNGAVVALSGARALAVSAGQPAALRLSPNDTSNAGAAGSDGVPSTLLAIPCGDDEIVGAIELADKMGGDTFSFDDVELVSLLGGIAGAALAAPSTGTDELVDSLASLRLRRPELYVEALRFIKALAASA